MDGWAGSSITAAAVHLTTSASAGRPCENPCARECRCLSQAGMGSAMENGTRMRDATDRLGEPIISSVIKSDEDVEKSHDGIYRLLLFEHHSDVIVYNMFYFLGLENKMGLS